MNRKLDNGVVENVATVVRAFGTCLNDYMTVIETGRLTAALETETIEIYQSIVAVFVPLLNCQRKKLKPSRRASIEAKVVHLCARIAKEYVNEDRIVVLSYFYGLRNPSAIDLLCQLIGQLFSHKAIVRIYARDPVERNWRKKIKARDLKTLLEVFSSIVRRIRQYALVTFRVIDSITKMKAGKLRKNIEIVLKQLSELVRE
ncbi:hypothetical protein F4860DRAFT_510249 [Xylaria cubensis]|nr:hypothetical protein F4860DRAFT_510249 [Xylaria cubensis]